MYVPLHKAPKLMDQDVDWHPEQADIFASVGDDRKLMLYV